MEVRRVKSPLSKKNKISNIIALAPIVTRSKSTVSFTKIKEQLRSAYQDKVLPKKTIQRAKSALRITDGQQYKLTNSNVLVKSTLSKMSKGKLHLGKLAKPDVILTNQMRHNPWGEHIPINQDVIGKKGLLNVIHMGMIPITADITELLNTKFQIDKKPKYLDEEENPLQIFATNPIIRSSLEYSQYKNENQKNQQLDQQTVSNNEIVPVESPGKKKRKKKIKKVLSKQQQQDKFLLIFSKPNVVLKIVNKQVIKDQEYKIQLEKSKLEGYIIEFKHYVKRFEQFAEKYHLKNFQFFLKINATKRLSDYKVCEHIINAKVLGILSAFHGGKHQKNKQMMRMLFYRCRYKKARRDLQKLENIKKYYRVKKFYVQMSSKRVDFLQFKLESFIENQRRHLEQIQQQNLKKCLKYRIQFHIPLLYISNLDKKSSFYKLKQRNNIQLTCLFNSSPEHLIIMMNQSAKKQLDISPWSNILERFHTYHSMVTIVNSSIGNQFEDRVKQYDEIYYGLNQKQVAKIKRILSCNSKKKSQYGDIGLIPSGFPNSVVKLTQLFDLALCGGSFLQQNIKHLKDQEEHQKPEQAIGHQNQFKFMKSPQETVINKLKKKTKEMNSFMLINRYFNEKFTSKQIFIDLGIQTPNCLFYYPQKKNDKQFYLKTFLMEFAKLIIEKKQVNVWIFKLKSEERFSRGLGLLDTDSLKIVKQKKKKQNICSEDIEELANTLKIIMEDKMIIPQNSLQDRNQFIQYFFQLGGYIEEYFQGASSCCLFGNLHPNGIYEHLGTYDKIYTDEVVNCAAYYPSTLITSQEILIVEKLSNKLFTEYGLYGKISFQFIYDLATNKYYLIDLVPSIEQYSSFYYLYNKYFGVEQSEYMKMSITKTYKNNSREFDKKAGYESINIKNKLQPLKRKILYCPFIDNNGNQFNNFEQFQESKDKHKLKMNYKALDGVQFLYLNLQDKIPDTLSMFSMADTPRKAFKFCLEGLNFLIETGDKPNKFDKKVERRKYDCILITDIIWKLRELKKKLDNEEMKLQKQLIQKKQ